MSDSNKQMEQNSPLKTSNWFASWFDSPYYHVLFKERDEMEAQLFMDNIVHYLNLPEDAKILDLACGKGRHARFIAEKGHHVTGLDLAVESIAAAKAFEHERLHFAVHDMRDTFAENEFDYVFNFFTSFGYFENKNDNFRAIESIATALRPQGFLVIDFMNARKVMDNLLQQEEKTLNEVDFHIRRYVEHGFIVKEINVLDSANDRSLQFEERVQVLALSDFKRFFKKYISP